MDIESIAEFIALAKRPNITSVAKELGISKSALSRHIAHMEEELGITLFEHQGSGIALSPQGADIFSSMHSIVAAYDDMLEHLTRIKMGTKSRLAISSTLDNQLVATALATLYSTLSARHESFALENVLPDYEKLPKLLKEQQVDLVLDYLWSPEMAEDLGFITVPIGRIPLVAVVNKSHHLANCETISVDQLRNEQIIRIRGHVREWCWTRVRDICRQRGFEPEFKSVFGTQLPDLVTMASRLQREILIVSETYLEPAGFANSPLVATIPFEDEDACYIQAVVYNPENQNPLLAEALDLINEAIAEQ